MARSLGMSLAAFDALPDRERGLWLAKWERDRETCGRCGFPRSECGHPDKAWFPQFTVCYPTMEQQAAQAKWERLHEKSPWHDGSFRNWSAKPSRSFPYHHSHGVTIWVSQEDLTPDDDFLGATAAQEVPSDQEQPDKGD